MNTSRFIRFCMMVFVALAFSTLARAVDDPSCMRVDCLGRCGSKEEMKGKAIPMLCMAKSVCYQKVDCTIQANGKCGYTETPELAECLAQKGRPPVGQPSYK